MDQNKRERQLRWIKKMDSMYWMEISKHLKAGLTQNQIGFILKITQPTVSAIVGLHGLGRAYRTAEIHACGQCGKQVRIVGLRRKSRTKFCSYECYWKYLQNPDYKRSVYGTKIARRVVSERFNLKPGNVVHHIDGDNDNNRPSNLQVFATQGEHNMWHRRGGDVKPIWDGSELS